MEIYLIKDGDLICVSNHEIAQSYINDGYVEYSKETLQVKAIKNKLFAIKKIEELKELLNNSDYKVMKCYEAFMRQQTLPYNLEQLSTQRDAWRAEINQLEEELKAL
jgi:hypothetical protein